MHHFLHPLINHLQVSIHFSSHNIQIKAFLPYRPFSEYNVKRLIVEGHQPPSLTTLSAAMPGKSTCRSWRGAGAQPPAHPASRCAGLAAAIGLHLLVCHHLLTKMVKNHTQHGPAGESLICSPQASKRRPGHRPHKGANRLGLASGGT